METFDLEQTSRLAALATTPAQQRDDAWCASVQSAVPNASLTALDPAALVLGPSGLVYNAANDTLYVASSSDNAIYEIPTATKTTSTVNATLLFQDFAHLHGPIDLVILPNGHFLVANSDGSNANPNEPSVLAEYTPTGQFLGQGPVGPNNGGAFGLATSNLAWGTFRMASVDDNTTP